MPAFLALFSSYSKILFCSCRDKLAEGLVPLLVTDQKLWTQLVCNVELVSLMMATCPHNYVYSYSTVGNQTVKFT